jgi:hypothetical protein
MHPEPLNRDAPMADDALRDPATAESRLVATIRSVRSRRKGTRR